MATHTTQVSSPLASFGEANIPSSYSRLIGRELELQVRDLSKLLKFTDLSVEQFMQEDTLLTAQQQIQILQNGLQLSHCEYFGLRIGRRLTPATHGAMGFLANSSPNLLMALKAFQIFLPTRMSFVSLELKSDAEWVECFIRFDVELSPAIHCALSETIAVIFMECAAFIIGRPLTEVSFNFTHPKPTYSEIYSQFLSGSSMFSAPELMIRVPMTVCQIPNASANYESYMLAMRECESILANLHLQLESKNQRITYQIQKMMLSHPLGELNEEDAAAILFVSKRTLARQLTKEGSSYKQIRDKILSQQASGYLRNSDLSVDAIAFLLNYYDSANFRRAFKRWFNLTPSQYREQVKHEFKSHQMN
jgi:AraC-like DNA-binding protein